MITFLSTSNGPAFNNGLVVDDFEFNSPSGPPVCTTTISPSVQILQPASNATFQTNNFPLQGQVATQSPLQSATLTVTNSAGTKSSNMLGTLVQQAGGPYGVTSVFDELAQGSNTVSVTAANCHGSTNNSVTVNYQPIAQGTRFKLIGMEVVQATQDLQNTGTPGRWQTLHGAPLPRRHSSLPALHRRAHRGCLHRPCSD